MGNEHSHHRPKHAEDKGAAKKQQQQPPAKKAQPSADEVAALGQSYDVVISSTPGDSELTSFLKAQLESASIPVYSDSRETDEAAKLVGKVLVDAKMLVVVVGDDTAKSSLCQDQVSLAYISNKPLVVASKKTKETIITGFSVGMKLTLQSLPWTVFDKDEEKEVVGRSFVQLVQDNLNKPVVETAEVVVTATLESQPSGIHRQRRINTKVRAQTLKSEDGGEGPDNTFWDRNFKSDESVPWYRFQQAFLTDYEAQLSGLFTQDNMPWLLKMLQKDIFGGAETVSKDHFMQIRGDSPDKNAFWRSFSQIAIEKFNMQEVFNMSSSVRLTAIEKLALFGSPAVIEALMALLKDQDPNVRAVAAISLGRTGVTDEYVIDALIELLKDQDRIVRQSACLSLGHMKAVKAIPDIGNIWRNDFISVVRNAARTALENMKIPEAETVLKVTKVLEEEIATLEGQHAAV